MANKNLIIHVVGDCSIIKMKLKVRELFKKYYDGWESTVKTGEYGSLRIISTRFYYYDITHEDLGNMLRALQNDREGHQVKIKIQPSTNGNHTFD